MQKKLSHKMLTCILVSAMALSTFGGAVGAEAAKKPTLSNTKLTVKVGETKKLSVKNKPAGASYKWSSNKKEIATVSSKGVVKGIKAGKATVSCKVKVKKKKTYSLKCAVTVSKNKTPKPTPSGTPKPTAESDETKLKKIIASQKAAGASISQDLDSTSYRWNSKGRLVSIDWEESNLRGSLDLSQLDALKEFECSENELTSLNVAGCLALEKLYCSGNQLTALDVTKCAKLQKLYCGSNKLTTLDVTKCPALTGLSCSNNQLKALDVTKCPALTYLSCSNNQLKALDVTKCVKLQTLYCTENQIKELDMSYCKDMDDYEFDFGVSAKLP